MEAWSAVRAIIASTPTEDMSRRAFFPKMIGSCAWCKVPQTRAAFQMKKADKKGLAAIYCGHACQQTAVNTALGKLGKNCLACGVKVPAKGPEYCSAECKQANKVKRWAEFVPSIPPRACETCTTIFTPKSNKNIGRFCSRPCKDAAHARHMLGKNNPGWRNGCYPARLNEHSAKAFLRAKPQIRERDGNQCVACESPNNLHVHHIDMDATNNRWRNLVTLCMPCHMKLHGADRSLPRKELFPWLSAYASQPRSSTCKWKEPSAFSQTACSCTTAESSMTP